MKTTDPAAPRPRARGRPVPARRVPRGGGGAGGARDPATRGAARAGRRPSNTPARERTKAGTARPQLRTAGPDSADTIYGSIGGIYILYTLSSYPDFKLSDALPRRKSRETLPR